MFRCPSDITENIIPKSKIEEEGEKQFLKCSFCPKSNLTSETELLIHKSLKHEQEVKTVTSRNPFFCRVCLVDCVDAGGLLQHYKIEHLYTSGDSFRVQREIFICDLCKTVFFNKLVLQVHIHRAHSKNMQPYEHIPCVACPKRIYVKFAWQHLESHDLQSVSTCPICFMKCRNKKSLLNHMKTHPRHLSCDMCMYDTKRDDLFRQHIIDKHKTNITCQTESEFLKYFTPECAVVWSYQKIAPHALQLTNNLRICILCREICVGESDMKQHICIDHSIKTVALKPKHLCTCGEMFTNKVLLKHHTFKLKGDHKMLE